MADTLIAPPPSSNATPVAPPASAAAPAAPVIVSPADSAEMDKLFGHSDPPETPPGAPKAEPVSAAPTKPRDETTGKFVPPAKAAPAAPAPQKVPEHFRVELERTKKEHKAATDKVAQMEARIAEAEAKGKDTEALMANMAALQKERDELAAERRALKQEASPEWKKQFEEPFNRAAKYAQRLITGLQTSEGHPANFERDFAPLYSLPYNAAIAKARETFGDDAAPLVMQQVAELQRLDYAKQEALEEEKKGWAEKSKVEEGQRVQQREQAKAIIEKVRSDLRETVDEYRNDPTDKELVAAREYGRKTFHFKPRTFEEYAKHEAHKEERLAAFPVMRLQLKRQASEIERLKVELAGSTETIPNPDGRKAGGADAPAEKSWDQEYNETVARS